MAQQHDQNNNVPKKTTTKSSSSSSFLTQPPKTTTMMMMFREEEILRHRQNVPVNVPPKTTNQNQNHQKHQNHQNHQHDYHHNPNNKNHRELLLLPQQPHESALAVQRHFLEQSKTGQVYSLQTKEKGTGTKKKRSGATGRNYYNDDDDVIFDRRSLIETTTTTTTAARVLLNNEHDDDNNNNLDYYYQPIRIHFDMSGLLRSAFVPKYNVAMEALKDHVLPQVQQLWQRSLRVLPLFFLSSSWKENNNNNQNVNDNDDDASVLLIEPKACGPSVDIPAFYATSGISNVDLVIFVKGVICETPNRLAAAFPCRLDRDTDRPIVGAITFCLDSKLLSLQQEQQQDQSSSSLSSSSFLSVDQLEQVTQVAAHEVAHVLGMSSTLYPYYRDSSKPNLPPLTPARPPELGRVMCADGTVRDDVPLVNESNTLRRDDQGDFLLVTPTVTQVARNQFGCQSLQGARLENQPTNEMDCYGSHWDERLFFTEYMGPILSNTAHTLSPLTLALMEDTGWYKGNYEESTISAFGHGAGCDFVSQECIIDGGTVPSYGKGFFCSQTLRAQKGGTLAGDYICDPTHYFMAQCDLVDHSILVKNDNDGDAPPLKYQYFDDSNVWPLSLSQADYCPIPHLSPFRCTNNENPDRKFSLEGESFSPSARCFNAQLPNLLNNVGSGSFPVCLETFCNPARKILQVLIHGTTINCDYDGQVHRYPSSSSSSSSDDGRQTTTTVDDVFECPRFAVVCPHLVCPENCRGRGICNFQKARCECFDPNDATDNCAMTSLGVTAPPTTPTTTPPQGPSSGSSTTDDFIPSSTTSSSAATFTMYNHRQNGRMMMQESLFSYYYYMTMTATTTTTTMTIGIVVVCLLLL